MKLNLEKVSIKSDNTGVNIKLNENVIIPKLTYKYYSLNSNSINSLKNNTIHFGHSYKMNDLMDGNFLLWDFEEFLDDYIKETRIDIKWRRFYHTTLLNKLSDDFLKHVGYFCM